jgi:hypothetical protein
MADNWWTEISSNELAQGDYILSCPVVVVPKNFDPEQGTGNSIKIEEQNVIIMTQSCDLQHKKAETMALCPVCTLDEIESSIPKFKENKKMWDDVRQGRIEGMHMLGGFKEPLINRESLIVDFRQIYSLPFDFLSGFAERIGARKRLSSPYLERLSQGFARFFMRVGLPSDIPPFSGNK